MACWCEDWVKFLSSSCLVNKEKKICLVRKEVVVFCWRFMAKGRVVRLQLKGRGKIMVTEVCSAYADFVGQ